MNKDLLIQTAKNLRDAGVDPSGVLEVIRTINTSYIASPFSDDELIEVIDITFEKENDSSLKNIDEIKQKITKSKDKNLLKGYLIKKSRYMYQDQIEEVISLLQNDGRFEMDWIISLAKQMNKMPSESVISNEIMSEMEIRYLEGKGFYIYNGKVWEFQSDKYIQKIIGQKMGKYKTGGRISSICRLLSADCFSTTPFDQNPLFNFQNCTLDLETGEVHEHRSSDLCSIIMTYDYDLTASYDQWANFVMDICNNNQERYNVLKKMCGYVLMNDCHLHKSFVLYGEGANGKSTFLNILEKVFNKNNVTSLRLDDLGDKFQVIKLVSSLVNLCTETKNVAKDGEANFKKIVAGENISGCFKGKDFITFKPRSKLIFALNQSLKSKELSYGFIRRLSFVKFEVRYVETPKHENERKINKQLEKELSENLSGIFNWCYEGYHELVETDCFEETIDDIEMKEMMMDSSSSVYAFFNDMDPFYDRRTTTDLYKQYIEWCEDNSIKLPCKINTFSEQFKIIASEKYRYRSTTINNKHFRGFEHIDFTGYS